MVAAMAVVVDAVTVVVLVVVCKLVTVASACETSVTFAVAGARETNDEQKAVPASTPSLTARAQELPQGTAEHLALTAVMEPKETAEGLMMMGCEGNDWCKERTSPNESD